jgi:hypothetical protein
MTRKIIFTAPFTVSVELNRFTSSAVTLRGYKASLITLVQPTSSRTISLCSSTSFPTAEKRKTEKQI